MRNAESLFFCRPNVDSALVSNACHMYKQQLPVNYRNGSSEVFQVSLEEVRSSVNLLLSESSGFINPNQLSYCFLLYKWMNLLEVLWLQEKVVMT